MGKSLAKIIFGATIIVTASLAGYGIGKKNIWYQIGAGAVAFAGAATSVVVGSRYPYQPKKRDNQNNDK